MSKNSPAKYHQDIKKEYKEKLVKDIKVFLKKGKKKVRICSRKNLSENEIQKLVGYRKKYYKKRKNS